MVASATTEPVVAFAFVQFYHCIHPLHRHLNYALTQHLTSTSHLSSEWSIVRGQLARDVAADKVEVPNSVPSCKEKLFIWLSTTVDLLKADRAGIVHCWEVRSPALPQTRWAERSHDIA